MDKKTLCAVGDSFMFGAELVKTHYPNLVAHLTNSELDTLEFDIPENKQLFEQYYTALNSMRFSSLMATELGYCYENYAQSGASQEGIKLQTYLLIESLKKRNIPLSSTTWVVGVTMPTRVMQLLEGNDQWFKTLCGRYNNLEFVLSRLTARSIFPGNFEDSHNEFSKEFTREFVMHFNSTNYLISWVMNLIDVANILRANNVEKLLFVNLYPTLPSIFKTVAVSITVKKMIEQILTTNGMKELIHPNDFTDLGEQLGITTQRCAGGHYDKHANEIIAKYLLTKL